MGDAFQALVKLLSSHVSKLEELCCGQPGVDEVKEMTVAGGDAGIDEVYAGLLARAGWRFSMSVQPGRAVIAAAI
jgi:hypothetical protein